MLANHDQSEWEWMGTKFKVNSGQFITSLESIKSYCGKGVTIQNIRSALARFEKLEFLTNKSTKTGRIITICNWDSYQITKEEHNIEANKEVTKTQQRGNKEVTSNKNDKKEKKDKNEINIPFDDFWNLYNKKVGDKKGCERKWSKLKDEQRQEIIGTLPKWMKQFKDKQYQPHPLTYLNQERWNDEININKDSSFD